MNQAIIGALGLVADLRAALGDPEGRMMQAELIDHARAVKAAQVRGDAALQVLRQIAAGKRRTREQRLAASFVALIDAVEDHHVSQQA